MAILIPGLLLAAASQKGVADRPIILDGSSDPYAAAFVYFTTPEGIYTFDRTAETWGRITAAAGLPDNNVGILGLDDGIIWAATAGDLGSADIKLNDWQAYGFAGVQGLAFDDDYAWAGGAFGLRRFDKYAERWDDIVTTPVNDILADRGDVWIAADSGVLRYRREYGKVEPASAPLGHWRRVIQTPGRIWLIGADQLAGLRKATDAWSVYNGASINAWAAAGDSLFAVSGDSVLLYDPASDNWRPLRLAEELPAVRGICLFGQELLFATDRGLVVYNTADRAARTYTTATGLVTDSLIGVFADARSIFAVSNRGIDQLDRATGIWRFEPIAAAATRRLDVVYLDDAGLHLRLVPNTDVKLTGRAFYSTSTFLPGDLDSLRHGSGPLGLLRDAARLATLRPLENVNLTMAGKHNSGRSASLYYDDTDPDQLSYGLGYRGIEGDALSRLNGGYLKSDFGDFDLIPGFATLGADARLKHRAHGLDLQGGRVRSTRHSDYFTGRLVDKAFRRRDVDYAKLAFFRLPGSRSRVPGTTDTIFADDRLPATNTPGTRVNWTIGGASGDFDPLLNGVDYFIDYHRGVVQFLAARKPTDQLVLVAGQDTVVIQSDSAPGRPVENTYFLGPAILPGSVELTITDRGGAAHPLAEFGLDEDGDGHIDPEFINHALGLLRFPADRPFPDTVYQHGASQYSLDFNCASYSDFYHLTNPPLLRNSETVVVDGDATTRGTDYVVDYTSGVLLFLRHDLVSDLSQVEVSYSSLEPDSGPWYYSAQPELVLAPKLRLAPGFTTIDREKLVHLSGRAELGDVADRGVRFVPQLAVNAAGKPGGAGLLTASSGALSARAEYRGYDAGFDGLGATDRRYGRLRHSAFLAGGYRPLAALRIDGQAQREYATDSLDRLATADYASVRLSYSGGRLPGGYVLYGRDRLPDNARTRMGANLAYEVEALESKFRFSGTLQDVAVTETTGRRARTIEYAAEAGFNLRAPIRGNVRLRRNRLTRATPTRQEFELAGRLSVDAVPGLYYNGTYEARTTAVPLPGAEDRRLEAYLYNDLGVAPGRWYSKLSVLNFTFGAGSNVDEYLRAEDPARPAPLVFLRPLDAGEVSSVSDIITWYGKAQLAPVSDLLVWWKRTTNLAGIGRYSLPVARPVAEDEIRLEYEPVALGAIIADWRRRTTRALPLTTLDNIYLEWNKPWTGRMRTRLTATARRQASDYLVAATHEAEMRVGGQAQCRFDARSYFTVDLGAARLRTNADAPYTYRTTYTILPGVGVNLNCFRFLFLQFNYQSTLPVAGPAVHTLSGRVAGQL